MDNHRQTSASITAARSDTESARQVIQVRPKQLIGLAQQAQSLPLQALGIKAMQSGHYVSSFKGRGMEFDEARLYQPGDDIRSIDWKVTARSGKTHTKLYREERERPVLICIDLRQSMFFATKGAFKSVISAQAVTLLAWSAILHNDRLGALIFSDHKHKEIRPNRGKAAVLHFIQALCEECRWQQETRTPNPDSLQNEIARLRRVAKPGSLVIISSDFSGIDANSEAHLAQLSRYCDVLILHISDPIERTLPADGRFRFCHDDHEIELNTFDSTIRQHYADRFNQHQAYVKNLCRKLNMHFLPISTDDHILSTLQSGLGIAKRRR